VWRIGFLDPAFGPAGRILPALRARLTELGYVEGQNLTVDVRWAEGDPTDYRSSPLTSCDSLRRSS